MYILVKKLSKIIQYQKTTPFHVYQDDGETNNFERTNEDQIKLRFRKLVYLNYISMERVNVRK